MSLERSVALSRKQTNWAAAALPKPGSASFRQGLRPERAVVALDAGSLSWGGVSVPFFIPFSIPDECLGSQQRVTPALLLREKGRGCLSDGLRGFEFPGTASCSKYRDL